MSHQENAPISITPGAIRFNTDSMKLEYFRISTEGGDTSSSDGRGRVAAGEWVQITTASPDIETGGTRGLFMGGGPSVTDTIDFIAVDTTGNATDFGNLTQSRWTGGSAASQTRAVCAGGEIPSGIVNTMDFGTFASTGNFTDFGDLSDSVGQGVGGASSSTRGVFLGGGTPSKSNVIQFITIATTGNGKNFGDLSYTADAQIEGICGSSTRGIAAGGNTGSKINNISFITISTLGDAADFGDLTLARSSIGTASNATRGIFAGALVGPAASSNIDHITIASLGDGQDFGDLTLARRTLGGTSNSVRGVFAGGYDAPPGPSGRVNLIDHITIASTGNAKDFGDLIEKVHENVGCSDSHGGLS